MTCLSVASLQLLPRHTSRRTFEPSNYDVRQPYLAIALFFVVFVGYCGRVPRGLRLFLWLIRRRIPAVRFRMWHRCVGVVWRRDCVTITCSSEVGIRVALPPWIAYSSIRWTSSWDFLFSLCDVQISPDQRITPPVGLGLKINQVGLCSQVATNISLTSRGVSSIQSLWVTEGATRFHLTRCGSSQSCGHISKTFTICAIE